MYKVIAYEAVIDLWVKALEKSTVSQYDTCWLTKELRLQMAKARHAAEEVRSYPKFST